MMSLNYAALNTRSDHKFEQMHFARWNGLGKSNELNALCVKILIRGYWEDGGKVRRKGGGGRQGE